MIIVIIIIILITTAYCHVVFGFLFPGPLVSQAYVSMFYFDNIVTMSTEQMFTLRYVC